MLDIAPDTPAPLAGPEPRTQALPELTALEETVAATPPARELTPLQDRTVEALRVGFEAARDTSLRPDAGELSFAAFTSDVNTFSASAAIGWAARGGYGELSDGAREPLLAVAGSDIGREALTVAYGREVDGQGGDVVVLLDRDGAQGAGHVAAAVQRGDGKWEFRSFDGTPDNFGLQGSPTRTNGDGTGQSGGETFRLYDSLDDLFNDAAISDRYEEAVRVEFGGDTSAARAAADVLLGQDYDLGALEDGNNCADVVRAVLHAVGNHDFDIETSRAFGREFVNPLDRRPTVTFENLRQAESGDDGQASSVNGTLHTQAYRDWQSRAEARDEASGK